MEGHRALEAGVDLGVVAAAAGVGLEVAARASQVSPLKQPSSYGQELGQSMPDTRATKAAGRSWGGVLLSDSHPSSNALTKVPGMRGTCMCLRIWVLAQE